MRFDLSFWGGDKIQEIDEAMLNSGGAGILLSRGSLSLLGKAWGLIESSTSSGQVHEGKGEQVHVVSGNIEAIRLACMATLEYEKANPGGILTSQDVGTTQYKTDFALNLPLRPC